MSQGGGGAAVLEGGYNFQIHLKEGVHFYSQYLGGYIFLRLVFSKSGVADVSFCSTSNITQKMAWESDVNLQRAVWVACCRALQCFGGKLSHTRDHVTRTNNTATVTATRVIFQFQSTTAGRERNIYSEFR